VKTATGDKDPGLAGGRAGSLSAGVDAGAILDSLPEAVIVVGPDGRIGYANGAAEDLFGTGAAHLVGRQLSHLFPDDSPIPAVLDQLDATGAVITEYEMSIARSYDGKKRLVDVRAALAGGDDGVVLSFFERGMARKIGDQLSFTGAARSVSGMAAVLAHEIKNPLSGVRGAAQLLERDTDPESAALARLIRDEADRICALVDRMEVFSDPRRVARGDVNIHRVLEHAVRLAEVGFARHVQIEKRFDPSLPAVWGNRDQLVQVFLNLLKNAAEAVPEEGGKITLTTAFSHGLHLQMPATGSRLSLPIEVRVDDNGPGIADSLRPHLFEPFVTGRRDGIGLGLTLVAKLVGDHGGVIEALPRPQGTCFRVLLPRGSGVAEEVPDGAGGAP